MQVDFTARAIVVVKLSLKLRSNNGIIGQIIAYPNLLRYKMGQNQYHCLASGVICKYLTVSAKSVKALIIFRGNYQG